MSCKERIARIMEDNKGRKLGYKNHIKHKEMSKLKSPSTNEILLAMDCTTQHIREFLAQSTNGEIADLGKVCGSNCEIWEAGRCKDFDWLKNLDPIISQSSVKISVCNAGDTNRG